MGTKHQKIEIKIPNDLPPADRKKLGEDIIEFIVDRTQKGIDKDGRPFKKYSKAYINSLDFKIAGKSKGKVDLQLSGDMLAALSVLDYSKEGKVVLGFKKGSEENAKADGNIRGTYGQSTPNPGKARDFLGINRRDLATIMAVYVQEQSNPGEEAEDDGET